VVLARELLPAYDCGTCTERLKKSRGCDGPPEQPVTLAGQPLDRCPMRPYLDAPVEVNELVTLYRWYKQGMLPDPGTVLDQPSTFVDAMLVIDGALAEAEASRQRAREEEARRAKQQGRVKGAKGRGKSRR
jgi:hypothetical protein